MLLLTSTSDLVQVVTGAVSTINVHASYMDNNAGTITPGRTNTATIVTAATTTVVAAPGSGVQRNVRHLSIFNNDAANASQITVQHTDGTNVEPLYSCNLAPGEKITFTQGGQWLHYDKYGGIYQAAPQSNLLFNASTAAQGAGFASDTYLTGSNILLPTSRPKVGTIYRVRFHASKTAAGVATPILTLRYGVNGTTADTALITFTFAAGTAAADVGWWEVNGVFRSVGAGTAAVIAGISALDSNLTTTGFSNAVKNVQVTSAGFDSTTANTILGVSVNGGASAAWTVQMVEARLENF